MTNKEIENFVEDLLNNHSEIFEYPKKYQDGGYEIAKGVFTGERGYQEYLKALKNIINYYITKDGYIYDGNTHKLLSK